MLAARLGKSRQVAATRNPGIRILGGLGMWRRREILEYKLLGGLGKWPTRNPGIQAIGWARQVAATRNPGMQAIGWARQVGGNGKSWRSGYWSLG